MIGKQLVAQSQQGCSISKLAQLQIPAWVWLVGQTGLFGVLIFSNFERDFAVTTFATIVATILVVSAFIIFIFSVYSLRNSLNVAPQPVKDGQMQSRGIYKYVRHPMYAAVFLITTGIAINSGSYWKFGVAAIVFVFFFIKTKYEENLLKAKYLGYEKYMKNTGRYFPIIFNKK